MSFTMPVQTYITPTGTIDVDLAFALVPTSGNTITASWTATGSVSFTGHFRNRSNNALVGAQSFVNNTSGSWIWTGDPNFNGSTPWGFELDTITNNGHNISVTFSVNGTGFNYSGLYVRRTNAWVFMPVYTRRSGIWVFTPMYVRRTNAWSLLHV